MVIDLDGMLDAAIESTVSASSGWGDSSKASPVLEAREDKDLDLCVTDLSNILPI